MILTSQYSVPHRPTRWVLLSQGPWEKCCPICSRLASQCYRSCQRTAKQRFLRAQNNRSELGVVLRFTCVIPADAVATDTNPYLCCTGQHFQCMLRGLVLMPLHLCC